MTKEAAIQAMDEGLKVTHRFFSPDEFIYKKNGEIHDEKNINMDSKFWELRSGYNWLNDWELY